MNTLAGKHIAVLIPEHNNGGSSFANTIEVILHSYEPGVHVVGKTIDELSLSDPVDAVMSVDIIRDGKIYTGTAQVVDIIRARTHQAMPVILCVSEPKRDPFFEAIAGKKNAFVFSHAECMAEAIRNAVGLPQ
jgi:hypothetical protein